jgi:hypothetical protein
MDALKTSAPLFRDGVEISRNATNGKAGRRSGEEWKAVLSVEWCALSVPTGSYSTSTESNQPFTDLNSKRKTPIKTDIFHFKR